MENTPDFWSDDWFFCIFQVGFLIIFGGFPGPFLEDFGGRFSHCLIQFWRVFGGGFFLDFRILF